MSGRKAARTQEKTKKAPRKRVAEEPSNDDRFKRTKDFDEDEVAIQPVDDEQDADIPEAALSDEHDESGDESDDGNYRFSDDEEEGVQAAQPTEDDDTAGKPKKKIASKLDLAALTPEQLKKYNEAAERR